jgi:hypothetical protein
LKQKLDRMLHIQKQCVENVNSDKVDVESLFWELASLYVIVNREAARPELNIQRPRFTMIAPKENYRDDPTLDKKENETRKRATYLPAVAEDDEVSKEEVQRLLEEVEREVEKKINEMMDGGGGGEDGGDGDGGSKGGTEMETETNTGAAKAEDKEEDQEEKQPEVEDEREKAAEEKAKEEEEEQKGGDDDREMTDAPPPPP